MLIPNKKNITGYADKFNEFILPVQGLSIGFNEYFTISEAKALSLKYNIHVIINKFFHSVEIEELHKMIDELNFVKSFFVEDLGVASLIERKRVVLFQNHITSSYANINALNEVGYEKIVVSNELTIDELTEIRKKCTSKLYYFLVNRNMLMYSRRKLITNYFKNYKIDDHKYLYHMNETVSKKELIFKEEGTSTCVFNGDVFCASKYLEKLNMDNYIINLNNIDEETINVIIENYDNTNLYQKIKCDYYFLENEINYKVKTDE